MSRPHHPQQPQRFLLRWHRHAPTIADQLPRMFDDGLFADVTLSVDGEHLRAHRLVLASCSPYFMQIFQEADRTQVDNPFVILLNAQLEDVRAILAFMYKGECCVYRERIPELLATARHLRVAGLAEMDAADYVKDESGGEEAAQTQARITNESPVPKLNRDVPETCKCFVCGKYLSNQYNLRVHMETHEETYHACSSCPHVSRSRDALRKHMSYRHPDKYNARKHKRLGLV